MSTEDDHFPTYGSTLVSFQDVAKIRQCLYDAKLMLSQGDIATANQKIIEALDVTTRWPA